MTKKPITISICCITYNHADYIKDAIDGFLMQKTSFPIEIIIHDDASTDGTVEIIKDYASRYPDLIFPVLQSENQYSKKQGGILPRFVWPRVRGRYIALCEGDDYWTDPLKLQKQVDELNKHPECYICFHPAIKHDETGIKRDEIMSDHFKSTRIVGIRDVILGGGSFMPTPSVVFYRFVIENLPDWYLKAPVGDYYLQILGSLNGGALYLNEKMAVHRINLNGSWTNMLNNADFRLEFCIQHLETLDLIDSYIGIFRNEFKKVKKKLLRSILNDRFIMVKARKEIYLNNSEYLNAMDKLLWNFMYQNSLLHNFLVNCKKVLISPFSD